jgi:hypothetical protein
MTVRPPSKWDRISYAIRGDGIAAAVSAGAVVGFVAGILSTADVWTGRTGLLRYVALWAVVAALIIALRQRWVRRSALGLFLRGGRRSVDPASPIAARSGTDNTRALTQKTARLVMLTATPDPVYIGTFRSLLHDDVRALIVTPCNPRDVSRPENLLNPIVVAQWDGAPLKVDLGRWTTGVELIRQLPRGNDVNHTFASRDFCYVAELSQQLARIGTPSTPVSRPEHCVDPDLLAEHDLVVLAGPDTNFWHAALYEAVARRFERPQSSVPLAVGLRDDSSHGLPIYGSADLFTRVVGAARSVGLRADAAGAVRISEVARPTMGFVLATTNPLSDPARPRWCVFSAGLRSVGTMAATLCLTSLLRALRADERRDFWSLVPSPDVSGAVGTVAAMLVRASTVEAAGAPDGARTARTMPHDRPDPDYRDSYIVTGAEVLDCHPAEPAWRPVTIDSFPTYERSPAS